MKWITLSPKNHEILLSMNTVDNLFVNQLGEIFQIFYTLRNEFYVSETGSNILYWIFNISYIRHWSPKAIFGLTESDIFI